MPIAIERSDNSVIDAHEKGIERLLGNDAQGAGEGYQ
jgi:hypothetical protein